MRDGYKDSLIGIIPDNWQVIKLNSLLDLLTDFEANGSFSDTKHNVQVKEKDGFAWYVRATDLEKNTPLNEVKYVNQSSYKYLRKSSLQGDELLITKRGEIGKVYYFTKPANLNATLAPNLYLLKLNSQVIPKFLYYYFISEKGNRTLKRIDASSALGALYKDDVKNLQVPLPPFAEQNEIMLILSAVDDKIGAINGRITQTEQLKSGLMQRLLTKGIGHTKFKDSPMGEIPESWDIVKLGNLGVFSKGKGISKSELSETGYPCIRYGEIYTVHNTLIKRYFSFISSEIAKLSVRIKKNDILFAGSGETVKDIGKAIAFIGDDEVFAGGDIIIFSPFETNSIFLSYCLNSKMILNQRSKFGQGHSVVHIYSRDLSTLLIPLPPAKEQNDIAEKFRIIDEKLDVLQEKKTKYIQLKTGLMQQLLTGKIRVNLNHDS